MTSPRVRVTIIGANNLPLVTTKGFSQPYCVIKLGETISTISVPKKTHAKIKNKNPKMNKTIFFDQFDPSQAVVKVEFWDINDETQEDIKIGEAIYPLNALKDGVEENVKLEVASNSFVYLSILPINFPCNKDESLIHFKFLSNLDVSDGTNTLNIKKSIEELSQVNLHNSDMQSPKFHLQHFKSEDIKRDFPHLSRGTFGIVYTGYVNSLLDQVVIKDIDIREQNTIVEWKREIEVMSKMRSPYIVDVIGYSATKSVLTIVMEYMPKGSLYDLIHIKKEKISLLQAMRMARHCALGLEHLHSMGVLHRDVKSMNILVGNDYSCKLTDFGNSKMLNQTDNLGINTANSGTPLWMAPEVKEGKAYSFSADVYSLGLVLFELFERKLPHYNEISQSVELPKQFNSSNVVLNCINNNPNLRPSSSTVVDILNKIVRNILYKVKDCLSEQDQAILKIQWMKNEKNDSDELESKLLLLYRHLLQKDSDEVNSLINIAFPNLNENSKHNNDNSSQLINLLPRSYQNESIL